MTPKTEIGATPSPAIVFELLQAHQRSSALTAAIELDLFRAIGEGPGDVASLARQCKTSERGMRILCDFLTIMGLLQKEDGRYRHTPVSAAFLDPRSPACVASIARFLSAPESQEPFRHLAQIVREGRTTLPGQGTVEADHPVWVEFARSMAPMTASSAPGLSRIVLDGLPGPLRVLDIAAGHGLFGIEIARQHPHAHIVSQDSAAVLEVARENAVKAGVAERFETLPGSAFDVDYAGPYDVVLLTNFLHHFDPEMCVGLLRKVRAALKPGGRAATLEFVPNEDRVTPPMAAAFSLIMLTSTVAGDAYTFREYEAMYREAGFSRISAQPVPGGPQTAVIGKG